MVALLLLRSSWRFHQRHPLQLFLSMLGIVLGVGIVTSVLITNNSALRAFALSSDALYGRATHQIVAANGISDEDAVQFIRANPQLTLSPIVETPAVLNGELVTLIGVDPFRESAFNRLQPNLASNTERNQKSANATSIDFDNTAPVWINTATAERLLLEVGDTLTINEQVVTLAGLFSTASSAAGDGLIVTDISYAQSLSNKQGKIDRLEMIVEPNDVAVLEEQLPNQWRLQATAQRQSTMQAMTRGFQINLTAMSLLALLVGMFLIHNTMTFAVLQRREVFATKRLVGVPSSHLFMLVMAEALVFSTIASLLGLIAGILIARKLLALTTQTINDLYFVLHVQEVNLSPWVLLAGLILGIGSSVIASILAANEAASGSAANARRRSAIELKTHKMLPLLLITGCASLFVGAALALLPTQSLLIGFSALMIVIIGYGLCIPWLSHFIIRQARKLLDSVNVLVSMSLSSLTNNISRTGLAIAALTVAVSATLGVDIMIGSFRNSVDTWLQKTLQSDLYITLGDTDGTGRSTARSLEENWLNTLEELPEIKDISTGILVDTLTNFDTFEMLVLSPSAVSESSYEWLDSSSSSSWEQFLQSNAVLVSEPMATKYALTQHSDITLFTELEGDVSFKVAGVYRDYGSSHGRMVIHRDTYNQYWNNPRIGSIGINASSGFTSTEAIASVNNHLQKLNSPARVRDNGSIHAESLAIFDRTFSVTEVLRWLTMGVAFVGIFSALLAMHLERARDFAVIRASGGSKLQLQLIIFFQSIGMGLTAGLLAIPLGLLMSQLLIHIINVRSFGWSMSNFLPAGAIPTTLLMSVGAAALAAIYPARRLTHQPLVKELRNE